MKNLICPCCDNELIYKPIPYENDATHAWVCEECPIIMFEYYYVNDIDNLKKI